MESKLNPPDCLDRYTPIVSEMSSEDILTTQSAEPVQSGFFNFKNIDISSFGFANDYTPPYSHNCIFYELYVKYIKYGLHTMTLNEYYPLIMSIVSSHSKVGMFYSIYTSSIQNDHTKEAFYDVYSKTSRCYTALNRFAVLCKNKYTKKYDLNTDMCMNSLANYDEKQVISIIEDGRLYRFWGKDLYMLINKKLSGHFEYSPEPAKLTNPYTNKMFNLSSLYKIYFFLVGTTWGPPKLFEYYFKCNFNMTIFKGLYYAEIREEIINETVRFMSDAHLIENVNDMLDSYITTNTPKISENYPKDVLRNHMLGYVKMYILSCNSLCVSKRQYYVRLLNTKLKQFFIDNPLFGRETIKRIPIYLNNNPFLATGKFKNEKKYQTNVIVNTFYHTDNFNENTRITQLIKNTNNIIGNSFMNGTTRHVIMELDDYLTSIDSDSDDRDDDDSDDRNDDDSDSDHDSGIFHRNPMS